MNHPSNSARRRTIGQALMEWEPLVRIYESRLWRRSPIWEALFRLSFEREYALIAEAAGLTETERLLDLACGPGIYARRFARELPRGTVVGMDLSRPMLRHAARRARQANLHNLAFVRGDAMELPFHADYFDAVNCCGALHLFPDVDQVLSEIRRVLKKEGRLSIAAFRCGAGRIAQVRTRIRRQLYGIGAFTPAGLGTQLEAAGFVGVRCLHSAGLWLVMVAQRAAA